MKVQIYTFSFLVLLAVVFGLKECPEVDGEKTVNAINPLDCSTFYSCANGVPILQHCPKRLEYNEEQGACDWPENANCVVTEVEEPGQVSPGTPSPSPPLLNKPRN